MALQDSDLPKLVELLNLIDIRMKQRRRTAAEWVSSNEVLLQGEWGLETDDRFLKIGEGTTAWNSLSYFNTDNVKEGVSNLFFTNARADARAGAVVATHVAAGDPHTQYHPAIVVKDEGSIVGASRTVTTFNFVGAGVAATYASGTLTVTIPGGGGSSGYNDPRNYLVDPMYDMLGKPPTNVGPVTGASYPWEVSRLDATAVISSINGGASAPGVWRFSVSAFNQAVGMSMGSVPNITPGAGKIVIPFRFRVPTLSDGTNSFVLQVGLADSFGGSTNRAALVTYTHSANSGKFYLSTKDAGVASTGLGGTTLVAGTFYSGRIEINAAGSTVDLYLGATLEATSSTNVPTGALFMGIVIFKTLGGSAAGAVEVDYFGPPQIEFTSPR